MFELLLGALLGALGGWWLTRRAEGPPTGGHTKSPTAGPSTGEARIVLPVYNESEATTESDAPPTPIGDINPGLNEALDAEPATDGGVSAYCVRCKAQRPMSHAESYTTANGRHALKGTCPVCGAGLFKFVKE